MKIDTKMVLGVVPLVEEKVAKVEVVSGDKDTVISEVENTTIDKESEGEIDKVETTPAK